MSPSDKTASSWESEVPQQKTALTFKGHFGVVAKSMD